MSPLQGPSFISPGNILIFCSGIWFVRTMMENEKEETNRGKCFNGDDFLFACFLKLFTLR